MKKIIFLVLTTALFSCSKEHKTEQQTAAAPDAPMIKILTRYVVKNKSIAPLDVQAPGSGDEGRPESMVIAGYKMYLEDMNKKEEIVYIMESEFNSFKQNDTIYLLK